MPWFTVHSLSPGTAIVICVCILIILQEYSELLQLLQTELSDSKQKVDKLESQLQSIQVHIICPIITICALFI